MKTFVKDPQAKLDYLVDWTQYLGVDTISSSSFSVGAKLTKVSEGNDASMATVWLSGGAVGDVELVTNTITTTLGRTDERSFFVSVQNR